MRSIWSPDRLARPIRLVEPHGAGLEIRPVPQSGLGLCDLAWRLVRVVDRVDCSVQPVQRGHGTEVVGVDRTPERVAEVDVGQPAPDFKAGASDRGEGRGGHGRDSRSCRHNSFTDPIAAVEQPPGNSAN
jgi:hypothetical protein